MSILCPEYAELFKRDIERLKRMHMNLVSQE